MKTFKRYFPLALHTRLLYFLPTLYMYIGFFFCICIYNFTSSLYIFHVLCPSFSVTLEHVERAKTAYHCAILYCATTVKQNHETVFDIKGSGMGPRSTYTSLVPFLANFMVLIAGRHSFVALASQDLTSNHFALDVCMAIIIYGENNIKDTS